MPDGLVLCQWLEQTWIASRVRESLWLFPAIETVHLLGMAALVGTISMFDLRLLGRALRTKRVSEVGRTLLPWTWAAFGLQVFTGIVLFSSEAVKLYANPAFRLKLLLILLAGIQVLIFHRTMYRGVAAWDGGQAIPMIAKIAALLSILLWLSIVAAGRFIGFV
jgi:hypothetical protein